MIVPLVDDALIVQPDPYPVVARDREPVGARRGVDIAGPPGREAISSNAWVWRACAPVMAKLGFLALQDRGSGQ